jgi:hypothetical protein
MKKGSQKSSEWEIPQHRIRRITRNKMEGRRPEGCTTDSRNTRLEESSWGWRRMEARFEGGQGSERAVVPFMDGWMDGWMDGLNFLVKLQRTQKRNPLPKALIGRGFVCK